MTDENVFDEEVPPGIDHQFEPRVSDVRDIIDIDDVVPDDVRHEIAMLHGKWREVETAAHRLIRRTVRARNLAEEYIMHAIKNGGLRGEAEDGMIAVFRQLSGAEQLDEAVYNVNECADVALGESVERRQSPVFDTFRRLEADEDARIEARDPEFERLLDEETAIEKGEGFWDGEKLVKVQPFEDREDGTA